MTLGILAQVNNSGAAGGREEMLLQLHLTGWPGPRGPLRKGRGSASAGTGQVSQTFSSPVRMGHTGRSFPLSECPLPHLEDGDSDPCSGAGLVS